MTNLRLINNEDSEEEKLLKNIKRSEKNKAIVMLVSAVFLSIGWIYIFIGIAGLVTNIAKQFGG